MATLVSVVLPVYNNQQDLIRCIESLRSQTLKEWEAVCVDDGSIDDSGKILDDIANIDSRFHIIHQKNGGVACARNIALSHVSAPYVTMLDADDYLQRDALERMLLFFRDQAVDMVITSMATIRKDGGVINSTLPLPAGILRFKVDYFFTLLPSVPWAKLYKTDIIKNHAIRFPEEMKMGEDAVFVAQYCCYVKNIYVLHEPLYVYDAASQTSVSQRFCMGVLSSEIYSRTLGLAALIYRLISQRRDSLHDLEQWKKHLLKIHLIEHNWIINYTSHSNEVKKQLKIVSQKHYSFLAEGVPHKVLFSLKFKAYCSLIKGKLRRFAGKIKRLFLFK